MDPEEEIERIQEEAAGKIIQLEDSIAELESLVNLNLNIVIVKGRLNRNP